MKLQRIFLFTWLIFNLFVQAMEERPLKPMPALIPDIEDETEQREQAGVLLELVDGNEVIFAIRVPLSSVQESPVLRNNLEFQEEEEGKELSIQLDTSAVTIEQLEAFQLYTIENYAQKNMEKALDLLLERWYPDNIRMFISLLTIADFIGNEHLYNACLQRTYELLKRALQERKSNVFFEVLNLIKPFGVRDSLKNIILKDSDLLSLAHLYKTNKIKQIGTFFYRYHDMLSEQHILAALPNKKWLVVTREKEEQQKPEYHFAKIILIPDNNVINKFEISRVTVSNVNQFYFSYSKKQLYYIEWNNEIKCFDIQTGELIKSIKAPKPVLFISFSRDNSLLAIALENEVIVYDMNTLEVKRKFNRQAGYFESVALSPDGSLLAFANQDRIEIWDFQSNDPIVTIPLNKDGVLTIHFCKNNRLLLWSNSIGEIKIYTIQSDQIETIYKIDDKVERRNLSCSIDISSDERFLAASFIPNQSTGQYQISILDLKTKSLVRAVKVPIPAYSLSFALDGSTLAFIAGHGKIFELNILPQKLQRKSLSSTLLLWYLLKQVEDNQPLQIPEGYQESFLELPKKIRKYFYEMNIAMGQSPTSIPYIPYLEEIKQPQEKILYLKEKRKKPEEKEGDKEKKKKSIHKRFKWD